MDITERKLAEQELLESRALLNDAQKLSHVGCWQYNPKDRRMIWSEEVYRIFGVDAQVFEPSYETALKLVHAEDRVAIGRAIDAAARTGEGFAIEFRIVQPNGMIRYIRSLGEVVGSTRGQPVTTVLGSLLDITEQKRADDALRAYAEQLTGLSRRLVEVQESERRQFSRELHDRIGQNLTALSINLDILKTQLAGEENAGVRLRLDDSSVLLESTSSSIENLLSELRPPMLDDYGLLSALQWYGNEFASRTGIDVKVHGDEKMQRLPPATEISLFRIVQEALNNVAKHAHANIVDVGLERAGAECIMSVVDDGVGFDSESVVHAKRRPGLGMVTMRERTQTIGGIFEVGAAPGGGTRVVVRVPC
jgi:signal transduction histidine kinase